MGLRQLLSGWRLRHLLTLGVAGSSLSVMLPAQALPESAVINTLANVPVFIVATPQGGYITNRLVQEAAGNQPRQEVALLNVFFSGEDAEAFLGQAQTENRALSDTAVVGWTELSALYTQAQVPADQLPSGSLPLRLLFIPEVEEVAAAIEVNPEYSGGVPLFIPRLSADNSYALFSISGINDGTPVVPVFFSQTDINAALDILEQQDSARRADITVEVTSLEQLITQMRNTEDENLTRLRLLPDADAINYINDMQ